MPFTRNLIYVPGPYIDADRLPEATAAENDRGWPGFYGIHWRICVVPNDKRMETLCIDEGIRGKGSFIFYGD